MSEGQKIRNFDLGHWLADQVANLMLGPRLVRKMKACQYVVRWAATRACEGVNINGEPCPKDYKEPEDWRDAPSVNLCLTCEARHALTIHG